MNMFNEIFNSISLDILPDNTNRKLNDLLRV